MAESFLEAQSRLDAETQIQAMLDEIEGNPPLVGIIMGSKSDEGVMAAAAQELAARGIGFEVNVLSAHRDPDAVRQYSVSAESRGLKVIIAGAGKAAALPGVVAAYTELPVIGVGGVMTGADARAVDDIAACCALFQRRRLPLPSAAGKLILYALSDLEGGDGPC